MNSDTSPQRIPRNSACLPAGSSLSLRIRRFLNPRSHFLNTKAFYLPLTLAIIHPRTPASAATYTPPSRLLSRQTP